MGGGLAVNVKDISGGFLSLNFLKWLKFSKKKKKLIYFPKTSQKC
jgi:hypothetical protein